MIFRSLDDKKLFLIEIMRIDLFPDLDDLWVPNGDLMELYATKRKGILGGLKDFRASQNTKAQWRSNRYGMMKGIKKFHRSTKGKRMHRALGTFMATRLTGDNETTGIIRQSIEAESFTETLKALSSLRTHVYIETEYYMPLSEYVAFLEFSEEILEASFNLERSILRFDDSFSEKDLDIVARSIDESVLMDEISKIINKPFDECHTKFLLLQEDPSKSYIEILRSI